MPPRGRRTRKRGAGLAFSKTAAPQTVPPFKYTKSEARKAWVTALYPHSPVLFKLLNSIQWSDYKYETPEYSMKCASKPYMIFGGSSAELYNDAFKLLPDTRLHNFVDATGDIDCELSPLVVTFKNPDLANILTFSVVQDTDAPYPVEGQEVIHSLPCTPSTSTDYTHPVLQPYIDHYTEWLLCQMQAFFQQNQQIFQEWFGHGIEFDKAKNAESEISDIQLSTPPFTLTRVLSPSENALKLQVVLSIPYIDDGEEQVVQDHIMEFRMFEDPSPVEKEKPIVELNSYLVSSIPSEIFNNTSAIEGRAEFQFTEKRHKYWNHVYRNQFWIELLGEYPNIVTKSELYGCLSQYIDGLNAMIDNGSSIDLVQGLFLSMPSIFRKEAYLGIYKPLIDRLEELLPPRGGRRNTRRKRRAFV